MIRIISYLARFRIVRAVMSWVISNMSFIIPSERLRETASWIAFYHPRPAYKFHILLIPKHEYKSLTEIPVEDTKVISELVVVVQSIIEEYKLNHTRYRIITNGGNYQDVPYLHFHLVADELK